MLGNGVFAYLHDIINASKDPEIHLGTLKAEGLKVKLSRCEF